ncbi:MAG: CopG family transcriptional regulator [Candidatus Korobacteraceae bacterium]
MKRTQLYLDEDLWQALHARARSEQTTISDLVRRAARERYLANLDQRREAMQAFVGTGKGRWNFENSQTYLRNLRRSSRMQRLNKA